MGKEARKVRPYLCRCGRLEGRVKLSDKLQVFFIQMFFLAFALFSAPFLPLCSAFGARFVLIIFVDNKAFLNLRSLLSATILCRMFWETYCARCVFIVIILIFFT